MFVKTILIVEHRTYQQSVAHCGCMVQAIWVWFGKVLNS